MGSWSNLSFAGALDGSRGRKRYIIPSILAILLSGLCIQIQALEIPNLNKRINDYAGMISPATTQHLESTLADFEASDSTQIVVLTIPSLDGESLEDFSIRVADRGIDEKSPPDTWKGVVDLIVKGIKQRRQADVICQAVDRVGRILETHFPAQPDNPGELKGLIVGD